MKDTDGHMRDKSWSNMTNAQKVNALKRVYEDASDEARDTIARKHYPKEYNAAKKKSK